MNQFLKTKIRVFCEVAVCIIVPYFLLEYFPIFPVHVLTPSAFDDYITFNDVSMWGYQSLYLFIFIRAFSFKEKKRLIDFANTFVLCAWLSFVVFFFYPTLCPRPEVAHTHWMYREFIKYEKPLNAFPSMHVSLVITTFMFTLNDKHVGLFYKFFGGIWTLWIIYTTMQSKQHVALDVVGGIVVFTLAFWLHKTKAPLTFLIKRWEAFENPSKQNLTTV